MSEEQFEDERAILELRIDILQSKIQEQSVTYDKMNNKMFAIVGLLLTFGGLLTYDGFRIDKPDNLLEQIVFVAGLLCLGVAAAVISYDYKAKKVWSVPIGPVEDAKLDREVSYIEALKLVHQDYQTCNVERGVAVDKKAKYLNASLYLFIAGVILMIVLKIGG